jgi:hypothetical protein
MATPTEIAFRTALAHPRAALDFLDRILDDQIRATLREMSDAELYYLGELIERRNAEAAEGRPRCELSAVERAILADLAGRRSARPPRASPNGGVVGIPRSPARLRTP